MKNKKTLSINKFKINIFSIYNLHIEKIIIAIKKNLIIFYKNLKYNNYYNDLYFGLNIYLKSNFGLKKFN